MLRVRRTVITFETWQEKELHVAEDRLLVKLFWKRTIDLCRAF